MTQTNEELKTKLYKIMSKDLVLSAKTHIEVMNAINEIMSLIPQPEQLEIEVYPIFKELGFNNDFFKVVYKNNGVWKSLFCAVDEVDCVKYLQRHNLNLRKKDIYEKS